MIQHLTQSRSRASGLSLGAALSALVAAFAVCLVFPGAPVALAEEPGEIGDAEKGRQLAEAHCVECHAPGDRGSAASFETIANTPGMTGTALSVWFRSPHPTMPDFVLAQEVQEDLIAYIKSQKSTE